MNTLTPGSDCFIRFRGRVWRGVITEFPQGDGFVQVRSECAAQICVRWQTCCFHVETMRGMYAKHAELIVPQKISEWAELNDEADNPPAGQYGVRKMAQEKPEPVAVQAVKAAWLPYKDEGWEDGE